MKKEISRENEPQYQDQVKHLNSGITGVVIAVYSGKNAEGIVTVYLDVRDGDDKIYYKTPRDNWKSIGKEEDIL